MKAPPFSVTADAMTFCRCTV